MAIKVKQGFELELPVLPMKCKDNETKKRGKKRKKKDKPYNTAKESSKSTADALAIGGYVEESVVNLIITARQKIRSVPDIPEYLPGIEKTYLLVNEADVVRASGQYLVYPVNIHLDALLPGVNLQIFCNSEVAENQQSRFDMRWLICRSGEPDVTAAILEFKSPYTLHRDEFERGRFQAGDAEKNMRIADRKTFGTWFEGNAIPLSKQVSKYSEFCKDIAIFDWSSLMIFDLHTWEKGQNRPARGAFYKEAENIGTFRLALLGFVLRGISRHL